jgi:hypothetical protein
MCLSGRKDGTAFHSTRNNQVKESMVPSSDAEVLIHLTKGISIRGINVAVAYQDLTNAFIKRTHRTVTASCFSTVLL